jgi:hypothetical protein
MKIKQFLLLSFLSMIFVNNTFAKTNIKRSFTIDFDEISSSGKTETAEEFFTRLYSKLNSNFSKNKNDFTYNFIENYFQNYSNLPKGIKNKEILSNTEYKMDKDLVRAKARFHFYNEKNEIQESNVTTSIRVRKSVDPITKRPSSVSFKLTNEFQWHIQQLIKLYLTLGNNDRLILDETSTTASIDETLRNAIKIDIDYRIYGDKIQQSVVEKEMNFLKEVIIKSINEARL